MILKYSLAIVIVLLISIPAIAVERYDNGRIKRSRAAVNSFKRENPCPANGNRRGSCPGYIVDHVVPLSCDGPDKPGNMQWQTVQEAKAKDKWERDGC